MLQVIGRQKSVRGSIVRSPSETVIIVIPNRLWGRWLIEARGVQVLGRTMRKFEKSLSMLIAVMEQHHHFDTASELRQILRGWEASQAQEDGDGGP